MKRNLEKEHLSIDAIFEALNSDPDLRTAAVNHLACKHAPDFLSRVTISPNTVRTATGAGGLNVVVISDKEWQE